MRIFFLTKIASLSAICMLGLSCDSATKDEKRTRIVMIPKGTTHLFWKSVETGAQQAAKEHDIDLTFIGPQREDDRSQQIDLVTNQAQKNDAVVLAPLDRIALRGVALQVAQMGKPVVIIDSSLADSDSFITSYIATDNREAGRMAARKIAELLDGNGQVAMMRYLQGSASTEQREEGFLEEIKKHSGISVVSSEQYAGATASQAQDTATNLLTRFTRDGKLTIDGIFTSNQSSTYGMLQSLRALSHAGNVKFIGFDGDASFIDAIKKKEMQGTLLQDPARMGYLGIKVAYAKLKGEPYEAIIDTGATMLTLENLDQPDIADLIQSQVP